MDKQALRRAMKAALQEVPPDLRTAWSSAICERVLALSMLPGAHTVMAYVGMATEPDTLPLIAALLALGKAVYLPVVRSKEAMEAVRLRDLSALQPGAMGILEPTGSEIGLPEAMDLLLVPGVAFDAVGHRLGHGAGYYDRFLAASRGVTVGLSFDLQVVDRVPVEAHDRPMQAVVTQCARYGRVDT